MVTAPRVRIMIRPVSGTVGYEIVGFIPAGIDYRQEQAHPAIARWIVAAALVWLTALAAYASLR